MTHNCNQSIFETASRDVGFEPVVYGWLRRIVDGLEGALQRRRERLQLAQLDDRMLRDLGISRADVDREVNTPMWR